ncbi:MAG: long-chain fatty acid--CoA ligase [Alphaproteobacteria bacterium]|nr:long-chain fatty acid--CoA ligase [Alphaproteobacteria bacterium]MDE2337630.1 long-chain fatty acid--CoA ligase [Alphaproteobacteria bacterium]
MQERETGKTAQPIFKNEQWIWEKHYPEGLSWRMPVLKKPLFHVFDHALAHYAENVLCDFMGKSYTYKTMGGYVARVAAGLQKMGVKKGVKVGLFLPNTPYSLMFYYGILKTGATVVNYNPLYVEHELTHQIEDSETDIMVTMDLKFLTDKLEKMFTATRLKKAIVCPMAGALPFPKNLLYPLFRAKDVSRVAYDGRYVRFADLVENDGRFDLAVVDAARDIAVLQYTGGTTGVPKGAVLTHANLYANVQQTIGWVGGIVDPGRDVMMGVLPFFHVFAMTVVLNCAVWEGMKIVLHPKFDLDALLASVEKHRPTLFPAVPAIFNAIAQSPRADKIDFSCLKYCMSGGAPLPEAVRRSFIDKTGCANLAEGYGMTETSPVVAFNPAQGKIKPGSVGMPIPGTIVEIIDKDDGVSVLNANEKGEVCISGPQVMKGYYNKPDETDEAMRHGHFHTGDVGYLDAEGYLYIVDRIKDMIIIRGYKVYPRFVEEALSKHPAVVECLVAGVPDEERGETAWAWVRLKGGRAATEEDLKEFLKDKVSPIELPRKIIIREKPLPRTAIGKLDKKAILVEEGIAKA